MVQSFFYNTNTRKSIVWRMNGKQNKKNFQKKNHFKVFYNNTLKQSKRLQFIQKKKYAKQVKNEKEEEFCNL